MNVTLMNPDPMNLWTRDRWTESGVAKMKNGKDPDPSVDQNAGWDPRRIIWCTQRSSLLEFSGEKLESESGSTRGTSITHLGTTKTGKEKNMKNFYDANPIDHTSPPDSVMQSKKKAIAKVVSARRRDQLRRPVCQLSQQRMFFEMELGEAIFPERV